MVSYISAHLIKLTTCAHTETHQAMHPVERYTAAYSVNIAYSVREDAATQHKHLLAVTVQTQNVQ